MATKRQREHSMIVASEKLVKRARRDCDRFGSKRLKWSYWFARYPTKTKGLKANGY